MTAAEGILARGHLLSHRLLQRRPMFGVGAFVILFFIRPFFAEVGFEGAFGHSAVVTIFADEMLHFVIVRQH